MTTHDLTRDLRDVARLASHDDGLDDLFRRGLDWLGRLAPYDLATIFALEGDDLVVKMARGPLSGPWSHGHRIALSKFPTIREALETRRARAFTEHDHDKGDGDPFDDVLHLPPGHACMVVPLAAADRIFGVLTLDRSKCEIYPQSVVDLAEVYAQILALALVNAEQRASLERLHRQDHEHAKLLEAELRGAGDDILESSRSPEVRELARRARQVAATHTPVLVLGETGTGKERLSRAIHDWSSRAEHPFVTINCAAIPAGLLESELFGHVKGAFTGASRDRAGRFQMANGGTLFLDEIGELPIELQAKILRVVQEGEFEPVGSDRSIKVDVRVVAATHVDLERAMSTGKFREDLYYRLSVFPLSLPPLRARLEDLPALAESILVEQAKRTGRSRMKLTTSALDKLRSHSWPGNIRELSNVIERATILSTDRELGAEAIDLPRTASTGISGALASERISLDEAQRRHIERVLVLTEGRIYGEGGAAMILRMKPSTLQSRMKKLGIKKKISHARTS